MTCDYELRGMAQYDRCGPMYFPVRKDTCNRPATFVFRRQALCDLHVRYVAAQHVPGIFEFGEDLALPACSQYDYSCHETAAYWLQHTDESTQPPREEVLLCCETHLHEVMNQIGGHAVVTVLPKRIEGLRGEQGEL